MRVEWDAEARRKPRRSGYMGAASSLLVQMLCALVPWLTVGCVGEHGPTASEGRMLYAENGCASCHGQTGRGDGPIAGTLDPKPADFRDPHPFKSGIDVDAIAAIIAKGIPADAKALATGAQGPAHHNQGMPPFAHLSLPERRSLALYVLSLRQESQ